MEKVRLDEFLKFNKEDLKGKIVIFPTDTVYGVGAIYGDENGINKIYEMKKRDFGKPLAVLCSDIRQVEEIAILPNYAYNYTKLWPGALTIICNKKDSKGTIAVRIPNSSIARDILSHFGPMSTTSVNYSGEKELNDIDEIYNTFFDKADYLITNKQELSKIPSTIISCLKEEVEIIREGSIVIKK
ncbi:MAG: threonylcarbamoyl-AMP synthase [Bacilli bacterium]|nr:threonylcarbamoyl-AMP synthase [Bacilli bacterium]